MKPSSELVRRSRWNSPKAKARRNKENVRHEETEDFLGNESVNLLAKQAAADRASILFVKDAEESST
jgi:hypothetical protein